MPAADPTLPPARWQLSAAGIEAAARLRLPPHAHLVASDEPKASGTVRVAAGGAHVVVDADFAEVRRQEPWDDDYRQRRRAYVSGSDHAGWEPRASVAARFDAAVARHAREDRPLVVGTHGMAMTCWLASRGLIDGPAGDFWAALAFPDVVDVELAP
jgi:broad specificity phosphatase PhoE